MTLHMVTAIVASSYLTLGIFATERARDLWWPYTIVVIVLAVAGLAREARDGRQT